MDGFIIQSGRFTSTGTPVILALPSTVDYIEVDNMSIIGTTPAASTGYSFRWQSGMANASAIQTANSAGAATLVENIVTVNGFTPINQGSDPLLGSPVASTGVSNVTQPVITVGTTASFGATGATATVLISQTAAQVTGINGVPGLLGIPFDVTVTNGTDLTFLPTLQQAQGVAATGATIRQVNIGSSFFPATKFIINVNVGTPTAPVITTSTAHGYLRGEKLFFWVQSTLNGMTQLNGKVGTVTNVGSAYTFTVDIDTTGFTAFTFPTAAQVVAAGYVYTPAQVAPYGENTAYAIANNLNAIAASAENVLLVGIKLGAGINGPAGVNTNVIQWRAYKSYNTFNSGENVNQNP